MAYQPVKKYNQYIYLQVQSQLPIETYDKRIASDSKPKQKSECNTIQKRDK